MKKPYSLLDGETETIDGFANKIGIFGGGGGKLVLTNQRLLFVNRRKTQVLQEIPLRDILHVGRASSATIWSIALIITLFLKNAIRITRKDGTTQRFVVNNGARWIDLTSEAVKSQKNI